MCNCYLTSAHWNVNLEGLFFDFTAIGLTVPSYVADNETEDSSALV